MVRSGKTRYGHAFSKGKNGTGLRTKTAMRGAPPQGPELTAVPHPENRPAAQVAKELIMMRVWEAIEQNVPIKISCDNCHHETVWTRGYMEKKLKKQLGVTLIRLASRLRCGGCRSNYIRVWKG